MILHACYVYPTSGHLGRVHTIRAPGTMYRIKVIEVYVDGYVQGCEGRVGTFQLFLVTSNNMII